MSHRRSLIRVRKLTDLSLRVFQAAELKKQVNEANIFSQTIIKYSLSRIFDQKRSAKYFSFEDEFIGKNYDFLKRIRVPREEDVFRLNEAATKMFFIEKGSIGIFSRGNRQIAELGVGECFGESAMLNDRTRRYTAVANKDSRLLLIEDDKVEKEIALIERGRCPQEIVGYGHWNASRVHKRVSSSPSRTKVVR